MSKDSRTKIHTLSHGKEIDIKEPSKLRAFKDGKHWKLREKKKKRRKVG